MSFGFDKTIESREFIKIYGVAKEASGLEPWFRDIKNENYRYYDHNYLMNLSGFLLRSTNL